MASTTRNRATIRLPRNLVTMPWTTISSAQLKYQYIVPMSMPHLEEKRMGELMALGKMDRTSLVEYTVTVYYTRTLARETHDLPTFIDQV